MHKKEKNPEFDKDYIFNLIMPSSGNIEPPNLTPDANEAPSPVLNQDDAITDSLSELRAKLFASGGLQVNESNGFVLINVMEHLVIEKLNDVFSKFRCCRCDKCKKDVVAIALNNLPPRYILSDPAEIDSVISKYRSQDVNSALIKAILQVKTHPRH